MPQNVFETAAEIKTRRIKAIQQRLFGTTKRSKREFSADDPIHSKVVGVETIQNIRLEPELVIRDFEDMQMALENVDARSFTPASSRGGSLGAAGQVPEEQSSLKAFTLEALAIEAEQDLPLWLLVANHLDVPAVKNSFMNLLNDYAAINFAGFQDLMLDVTEDGYDFGKCIVLDHNESNSRKYLGLLRILLGPDLSHVDQVYEILVRLAEDDDRSSPLSFFACLKGNSKLVYEDYLDLIISIEPRLNVEQLATLFTQADRRGCNLGMLVFRGGSTVGRRKYFELLKKLPSKDLAAIFTQENTKGTNFIGYLAYYVDPTFKKQCFEFIREQLDLAIRNSDEVMIRALSKAFSSTKIFRDLITMSHGVSTLETYSIIMQRLVEYRLNHSHSRLGLTPDEAAQAVVYEEAIEERIEDIGSRSPEEKRQFAEEMCLLIKADLLDEIALSLLSPIANEIVKILVEPPSSLQAIFPSNADAVFKQCFRAAVDTRDPFYQFFATHSFRQLPRLIGVLEKQADRVLEELLRLDRDEALRGFFDAEKLQGLSEKFVDIIARDSDEQNQITLSFATHDPIGHPNLYVAIDEKFREQIGQRILVRHLGKVLAYINDKKVPTEARESLEYLKLNVASYIVSLNQADAFGYIIEAYSNSSLGQYFNLDPKVYEIFKPILKQNIAGVIAFIRSGAISGISLELLSDLKGDIADYIKGLPTDDLVRFNREVGDANTSLGKLFSVQRGSFPVSPITGKKGALNRELLGRRFKGDFTALTPERSTVMPGGSGGAASGSGLAPALNTHVSATTLGSSVRRRLERQVGRIDRGAPDDDGVELMPITRGGGGGSAAAEDKKPGASHHH